MHSLLLAWFLLLSAISQGKVLRTTSQLKSLYKSEKKVFSWYSFSRHVLYLQLFLITHVNAGAAMFV